MHLNHISNAGSGPDVVLIHGNSLDGGSWDRQLNDPALGHLRLTAIDLPGHGGSERYPVDRSYSLQSFAEDVAAHIRHLNNPVLVGHSLGGHTCMRVLALAPQVRKLLIFGAPPLSGAASMATAFLPNPHLAHAFQAELTLHEALELAEAWTWDGCPYTARLAATIQHTDPRVRGDLGAALASGNLADELAMLRASSAEICMVHGADDPFLAFDYLNALAPAHFWRGTVHRIADAGHSPQLHQPARFNTLLNEFISAP